MNGDGISDSGTSTDLVRLKVFGRHFVFHPQTLRHMELDGPTCHRLGPPAVGRTAALELADLFVPAGVEVARAVPEGAGNPFFRNLILQVCHACNLRCRYCNADFGRYGGDFRTMSARSAQKAVDFLFDTSRSNRLAVTYFGGEPLLNLETVLSSARHARARAVEEGRDVELHLVTNGVLLTPRTLFRLDALDFSLTVSLDGTPACHDACRPFPDGRGSYRTIARALEIAGELPIGRRTTVRGTFTRPSAAFFPQVRSLVESGFSKNIAYEPVFLPRLHPLALRWRDLPAVKRAYGELARYYVARWRDGTPFCLWDFDDAILQLARAKPRRARCGAGVTTLAVTAEEELYACHMSTGLAGAKLGNLQQGLIASIDKPWRERYLQGRSGCSHCWLRGVCGGGCNTHALFYNRSLSRPYRLECALIAHRYRLAFWILSEIPDLKPLIALDDRGGGRDAGHLLQSPLWFLLEQGSPAGVDHPPHEEDRAAGMIADQK